MVIPFLKDLTKRIFLQLSVFFPFTANILGLLKQTRAKEEKSKENEIIIITLGRSTRAMIFPRRRVSFFARACLSVFFFLQL